MRLHDVVCNPTATPEALGGFVFNEIAPFWFLFLALVAIAFQKQTQWFTRFNIFTVLLVGMFVRYGIAVPLSDTINPTSSTHTPISQAQLINWYVALVITYVGVFIGAFIVYRWARWPTLLRAWPSWVNTRALIIAATVVLALVVIVWVVLPWGDFKAGLINAGHLQQLGARAQRVTYGNSTLYSNSLLNSVSYTHLTLPTKA